MVPRLAILRSSSRGVSIRERGRYLGTRAYKELVQRFARGREFVER
jgi:hypothetical protein